MVWEGPYGNKELEGVIPHSPLPTSPREEGGGRREEGASAR